MSQFGENLGTDRGTDRRTDGRMDGQTLFYRTLLVKARGLIKEALFSGNL